jgi:uncharacterized protein
MNKPVGWFEIYVQDMERAKAFYEAVFQVRLEELPSPSPDDQMWAFPGAMDQTNGSSGALVKSATIGPGTGGTVVYFICEDCAVESARAASAGGKVLEEKMSIGEYGFAALVADSEGNRIGLHSMQ